MKAIRIFGKVIWYGLLGIAIIGAIILGVALYMTLCDVQGHRPF